MYSFLFSLTVVMESLPYSDWSHNMPISLPFNVVNAFRFTLVIFFFQSSHTLCVQSRIDLNSICYYVSIVEHSSIAYLNITLISLRWHEDWFVRKQFQYEKILFFFYFSRHCVHNKYVIPFYLQFPSIVQPFIVIPTSTKGWRLNGAYVEWLQPVMNFLFSIIIQL